MDRPKVLVVEDETMIMMGLEDVLTEAGYDVVGAADAASALQVLDLDYPTIQCVVTDIRLPGKVNGWDIARRARVSPWHADRIHQRRQRH